MPNDAHMQQFFEDTANVLAQNRLALSNILEKYATIANGASEPSAPDALHFTAQEIEALIWQTRLLEAHVRSGASVEMANTSVSGMQLLQWQEEERAKTAKQLEDTDGQLLANAIFELAAVKSLIMDDYAESDPVMAGIDALQQELEDGLANLRFLVADLEPGTMLGSFGLQAGLRRYLEKFQERVGLPTKLDMRTLVEPLPFIIETAIFRILQEILHNIAEHAEASSVTITVLEADGQLQFIVEDNGIGIVENLTNHPRRQLGLVSITEIARLLHGTIRITSTANVGTTVILSMPYPKF